MGLEFKVAITTHGRKRRRIDAPSSSTSAPLGDGSGLQGALEDATSDRHSVFEASALSQVSAGFLEASPQGEPPTGGSKWKFNLEEEETVPLLEFPPVPAGLSIMEPLPREEDREIVQEAVLWGMISCVQGHRIAAMAG